MVPRRTRISCYALLVEEGHILLCRISDEVPNAAGQWTLPGGGLEFGEDPVDGVIREVREETGVEARVKAVAGITSRLFEFENEDVHVIRLLYFAEVVGGELAHEIEGSTDRAEWFTRPEADSLPLVEIARQGINLAFKS